MIWNLILLVLGGVALWLLLIGSCRQFWVKESVRSVGLPIWPGPMWLLPVTTALRLLHFFWVTRVILPWRARRAGYPIEIQACLEVVAMLLVTTQAAPREFRVPLAQLLAAADRLRRDPDRVAKLEAPINAAQAGVEALAAWRRDGGK